ncbi:UNVERIFIED_ORG: transposase InsO family protein [Chitinophaga ginsengisegetis]|nr:transposase InsO family protein [Chitinophaga ginsengisegetis]MDR6647236.1 transposase InsO family protein [Chitinophaga ginsengisegetis]MDR6653585.1 transposase InsO family protein [Chitinophaga ginsengisegetis]
MPRLGTRKLYHLLQQHLAPHHVHVGRDHLFDLLAAHHMLVRQRKRKVTTTDSHHWMHKYTNLAAGLTLERPEQLWVSDITYIRLTNEFGYLSLITDAYSRKIVGFDFRLDLSAQGCLNALTMALSQRNTPWRQLMHHSDRGSQYCCKEYVDLLTDNKITISMTENGSPYENALAERVNGIIKAEFNLYCRMNGFEQMKEIINKTITAYNSARPHGSCDFLTPLQAHEQTGTLKKRWKNYKKLSNTKLQHI